MFHLFPRLATRRVSHAEIGLRMAQGTLKVAPDAWKAFPTEDDAMDLIAGFYAGIWGEPPGKKAEYEGRWLLGNYRVGDAAIHILMDTGLAFIEVVLAE
ncbi:hypothetical protein [Paludisphaera sp.]|uniref:hypothetical protein n=1 Tax=Paludisphaera sp. TaxID=2017432 RepID=UPI00301DCB61